jgi:F0F1-type ATP synthase assembly protein I
MLLLLAGTLAFFVPHTFFVGLRELFRKKRKEGK